MLFRKKTSEHQKLIKRLEQLEEKIESLTQLNNKLTEDLEILSQSKSAHNQKSIKNKNEITTNYISDFVDDWYEKHKEIDIGVINIPMIGDIDILPDNIEKHIYKKTLLIVSSLIENITKDIKLNVLNKSIKIVID